MAEKNKRDSRRPAQPSLRPWLWLSFAVHLAILIGGPDIGARNATGEGIGEPVITVELAADLPSESQAETAETTPQETTAPEPETVPETVAEPLPEPQREPADVAALAPSPEPQREPEPAPAEPEPHAAAEPPAARQPEPVPEPEPAPAVPEPRAPAEPPVARAPEPEPEPERPQLAESDPLALPEPKSVAPPEPVPVEPPSAQRAEPAPQPQQQAEASPQAIPRPLPKPEKPPAAKPSPPRATKPAAPSPPAPRKQQQALARPPGGSRNPGTGRKGGLLDPYIAKYRARLAKLKETFTDKHPDVVATTRILAQLEAKSEPLTDEDYRRIRQQIASCWHPPALDSGTRPAVALEIALDPEGRVVEVRDADPGRAAEEEDYRAVSESAQDAVRKCSPLWLPLSAFQAWRTLVLELDPEQRASR
jgi:hypothetical protein